MKIFIYVCVFLCLYSCSESKHISEELNRTEEIINDYPDSVLRSLQAIAPGSICKKSTKAHYGLLYSMRPRQYQERNFCRFVPFRRK